MQKTWDVIIVGGGPVGAYAAIELAQAGHAVRVIEKDSAPYSLPRAVHIDHEIMRLFAGVGVADQMLAQMRAGDGHLHIGADQGVIRFMSAAGKPRPFGYANDYFFNQPELETTLRERLADLQNAQLDLGVEVTDLTQDETGATISLSDGSTAQAQWVIGCDGARSLVRKSQDIPLDDLEFEEPWLVVDAEVDGPIAFPDLTGVPDGANLQNLSVMLCDPKRPATLVPGRGDHRRWEFMLLPGESDAEMAKPAKVAELIAPYIADRPHKVIRAATYRFHGLVAKDWRKGRLFLAGDAAHQTPPFFGQGLCHGFRDAANLAWKLDLVSKGRAHDTLLDTYQTERDPQVRHVISRAIDAGRYICELDPEKAAARDARLRAKTGMETAAELIAPIASDIVGPDAGARFINPAMPDGAMMDTTTGTSWRLFHRADVEVPHSDVLDGLGVRNVALPVDTEGHLETWFAGRGAAFALIRPDHYVALVAANADELSRQLTTHSPLAPEAVAAE